jgi:hypothetical protein
MYPHRDSSPAGGFLAPRSQLAGGYRQGDSLAEGGCVVDRHVALDPGWRRFPRARGGRPNYEFDGDYFMPGRACALGPEQLC